MYSQLYRYITSFSLVDFKDQFYIVQVLYHVQHSKPIDIEKQSSFYVFMNDNYCNRIHIYEKTINFTFLSLAIVAICLPSFENDSPVGMVLH